MKKTININLGGTVFHIDEDAFARLESYINSLRAQFASTPGSEEIISDVELRMAELFQEKRSSPDGVLSLPLVEEVIGVMGKPEDYLDSSDTPPHSGEVPPPGSTFQGPKKLLRDPDGRILGGVAAGLAYYFGIDVIWIRLLFLVLLFTGGLALLIYLILWLVVPKARTTTDRLRMRGRPVNLSTIEQGRQSYASNYSGVGQFLSRLGQVLGAIIRFLLKVIGVFLLVGIAGSIILAIIGLVSSSGGIFRDAGFQEMLRYVIADQEVINILTIGLLLLILPLLIFLLHFALQLVTQVQSLPATTRNGMLLLIVVGLVMTSYAGIKVGQEFEEENSYSQRMTLDTGKQYHILSLARDAISAKISKDDGWRDLHIFQDTILAVDDVEFDIRRSERDFSYLRTEVKSEGPTERAAIDYARMVDYPLEYREDTLQFKDYFLLPGRATLRKQEVRLVLYLRPGDTLMLEESMEAILDDVENLHDTWDWDMGGHRWTMTQEGLACVACPADILRKAESDGREAKDAKEDLMDIHLKIEGLEGLKKLKELKELESLEKLKQLDDTTLENFKIEIDGEQVTIKKR